MTKITSKLWSETPKDYKLIKNGVKYIILTEGCLEPCEIDDLKGLRHVGLIISSKGYKNCFNRVLYNPQLTKLDNFKNYLKRCLADSVGYEKYLVENGFIKEEDLQVLM